MSRSMLLVLGPVIGASACASTGEQLDSGEPEVCITVDNRRGTGAGGRVFLVSGTNERIRMGEVPMGRQVTRCLQRSNFGGRWHILIEAAPESTIDPANNELKARPIQSPDFSLHPGERVAWDVRMNRIRKGGSAGGGNGAQDAKSPRNPSRSRASGANCTPATGLEPVTLWLTASCSTN